MPKDMPIRPEPPESRVVKRPSAARVLAVLDWLLSLPMPELEEQERRIREQAGRPGATSRCPAEG